MRNRIRWCRVLDVGRSFHRGDATIDSYERCPTPKDRAVSRALTRFLDASIHLNLLAGAAGMLMRGRKITPNASELLFVHSLGLLSEFASRMSDREFVLEKIIEESARQTTRTRVRALTRIATAMASAYAGSPDDGARQEVASLIEERLAPLVRWSRLRGDYLGQISLRACRRMSGSAVATGSLSCTGRCSTTRRSR